MRPTLYVYGQWVLPGDADRFLPSLSRRSDGSWRLLYLDGQGGKQQRTVPSDLFDALNEKVMIAKAVNLLRSAGIEIDHWELSRNVN